MKRLFLLVLFVALFNLSTVAVGEFLAADSPLFAEYQVKGAFLYKLAKFTQWPEECFSDSATPISILIFGKDPFGDTLNTFKSVRVHGRPLSVKVTTRIEELKECHVVFVCASERRRYEEVLTALKGLPVLIVGETEDFTSQNGAVAFITSGGKVQLEINLEALRRSGLIVGSQLLVAARIVRP